ncbi:hypothetical protein K458DRAFT_68199 [Lentithecium fluviatile CBS 122367]|uniref:Uncharacterized protein n=1 Tax=Lentithecium fluviatile CBS 122367 TaxID=1168545 RepID=A0A6G1JKU6_9PLEO|nr:hypothetical protein K458DRAFT_68199 [Lentithecium fluviatile CBS 122367]
MRRTPQDPGNAFEGGEASPYRIPGSSMSDNHACELCSCLRDAPSKDKSARIATAGTASGGCVAPCRLSHDPLARTPSPSGGQGLGMRGVVPADPAPSIYQHRGLVQGYPVDNSRYCSAADIHAESARPKHFCTTLLVCADDLHVRFPLRLAPKMRAVGISSCDFFSDMQLPLSLSPSLPKVETLSSLQSEHLSPASAPHHH